MEGQAQQVFDKMYSSDHFSQWMDIKLVTISKGTCTLKMVVQKEMLNGFGILHGGVAYALADSAFAFAANSRNQVTVSTSGLITFAKSAKEGDLIFAEATELRLGGQTSEYDVEVKSENGEVYYRLRTTAFRKAAPLIKNSNTE
jgi:acyl-CoA thioesterase